MEGHDRGRERRYSIQKSLYEICFFLEFALAILVISFVVIEFFSEAVLFIRNIPEVTLGGLDYSVHLKRALDIVIGIEFIKMLCRHNMDSVIEVLMFAMTRHLIVERGCRFDPFCGTKVSLRRQDRPHTFFRQEGGKHGSDGDSCLRQGRISCKYAPAVTQLRLAHILYQSSELTAYAAVRLASGFSYSVLPLPQAVPVNLHDPPSSPDAL